MTGPQPTAMPVDEGDPPRPPQAVLPPDVGALAAGLASVMRANGFAGDLTPVERVPSLYMSRALNEVVTCRTGDGDVLRLLCKYDHRPAQRGGAHGHRHGLAHEALVYRAVLRPLGANVPHCFGSYREPGGERVWLVLQYLDGAVRVTESPDSEAIVSAAAWVGWFQAAAERERLIPTAPLPAYDADYYRGWALRTLDFARRAGCAPSWLPRVCERADEFIGVLLEAAPTVVHGELYPKNVLTHDGRIVPVDWETAAVAAGEIDLASLTEGWPPAIARRCRHAYRRARWPSGGGDLERALAAARVYWSLRWLGERPEWLDDPGFRSRFSTLRRAARDAGLL